MTMNTHYLKMDGLKNMQQRKKFKVEMIVDCKPSLIEHLLEEICETVSFENSLVNQYNYYGITHVEESECN
jgi:hypothetical protein